MVSISMEESQKLFQDVKSVRILKKVIRENERLFLHRESIVRILERSYKDCLICNKTQLFSIMLFGDDDGNFIYYHHFWVFVDGTIKWIEMIER